MNHTFNQWINQPSDIELVRVVDINECVNYLVYQSVNHLTYKSATYSLGNHCDNDHHISSPFASRHLRRSCIHSFKLSLKLLCYLTNVVNLLIIQSVSQSITESINQLFNHSINQPSNQAINSLTLSSLLQWTYYIKQVLQFPSCHTSYLCITAQAMQLVSVVLNCISLICWRKGPLLAL